MRYISVMIVILISVNSYAAEVCGTRVYLNISLSGCSDVAASYTPEAGCRNAGAAVDGCVNVYTICCDDPKRYEDAGTRVSRLTNVDIGNEYSAASEFYENNKDTLTAPGCAGGYRASSSMQGFVYDIKPTTADYKKSDVDVTWWSRVGCEKFNNTTSIPLGGIGGGSGGGSGSVTVDMMETNTKLDAIKQAIDNGTTANSPQGVIDAINALKAMLDAGGSGNNKVVLDSIKGLMEGLDGKTVEGNQLLTDIKNILQSGGGTGGGGSTCVDANADGIDDNTGQPCSTGGGGGGGTDMTETNGILTGIGDTLTGLYDLVAGFFDTTGETGMVDQPTTDAMPRVEDLQPVDQLRTDLQQSLEYQGRTFLDVYQSHQQEWSQSPVFGFINNFNVSMGSSLPVYDLSIPSWNVNYQFDFSSYAWAFDIMRTLVIMGSVVWAYQIVFKA